MRIEDEDVPLTPLNELIWKFRKRLRVLTLLLVFSIPAAITSTLIFLLFFANFGITSSTGVVFAFLLLSAGASLIATVVIPDSLSGILDNIEKAAKMVAFTVTHPRGNSPQEKLLNQLKNTDMNVRRLLKDDSKLAGLNVEINGKSGRKYTFDVYIYKKRNILFRMLGLMDEYIIIKRFDQPEPLTRNRVKEFKEQVKDVLKGRDIPSRVILVSTSGFDDSVFEYSGSKEGVFSKRHPSLQSGIELVKENLDGTFDALTF